MHVACRHHATICCERIQDRWHDRLWPPRRDDASVGEELWGTLVREEHTPSIETRQHVHHILTGGGEVHVHPHAHHYGIGKERQGLGKEPFVVLDRRLPSV